MKIELDQGLNFLGENKICDIESQCLLYKLDVVISTLNWILNSPMWSIDGFERKKDLDLVIAETYKQQTQTPIPKTFFSNEGIKAKVFNPQSNSWIEGKIRTKMVVEFVPDKPQKAESPLDEIRREMQKEQH